MKLLRLRLRRRKLRKSRLVLTNEIKALQISAVPFLSSYLFLLVDLCFISETSQLFHLA